MAVEILAESRYTGIFVKALNGVNKRDGDVLAPRSCSPELCVTLTREEALLYSNAGLNAAIKDSQLPSPYHLDWIKRIVRDIPESPSERVALGEIRRRLVYIKR